MASASTINIYSSNEQANIVQPVNSNSSLDDATRYLDKFVLVSNGRYTISGEAKLNLTSEQYNKLTDRLSLVNQQISDNGWGIDQGTKSIIEPQERISGMTTSAFWWGTRYYFYTNQAVHDFSWKLKSLATTIGIGGAVTGFIDPLLPVFTTVRGGALAWDAEQLEHYNNNHIHSHIYMDINSASAGASFGTF